jgi:GNAT superfamily N-acetyltransferase
MSYRSRAVGRIPVSASRARLDHGRGYHGTFLLRTMCREERVWVAVDDADEPVAFLAVHTLDGLLHIAEVSVAWSHQRQGLGAALIAEAAAYGTTLISRSFADNRPPHAPGRAILFQTRIYGNRCVDSGIGAFTETANRGRSGPRPVEAMRHDENALVTHPTMRCGPWLQC